MDVAVSILWLVDIFCRIMGNVVFHQDVAVNNYYLNYVEIMQTDGFNKSID